MSQATASQHSALREATVVVIVVIIAASGAVYLLVNSGRSSSITLALSHSSTAAGGIGSSVYQVLERNLTLRGQAAAVPCIGFNEANCPSTTNATLSDVELIHYGDTQYYLSTYAETPSGYGTMSNASTTVTYYPKTSYYTTWFTNSSVFCTSPAHPLTNTEHQNRTCPTEPYHATDFTIPTPSTSTLNSTLGLRLDLALSSNSSGVTVTVDEFNTFNHSNNLTRAGRWPISQGDLFLWLQDGCGPPSDIPIGYAVLQGNYSLDNFRGGVPLTLEAQPVVFCPYVAPVRSFVFMPLSDEATTYIQAPAPSWQQESSNASVSTACHWTPGSGCYWSGLGTWSGYWVGSLLPSTSVFGGACPDQAPPYDCPLVFDEFPPGVYTVVAADEWGQVVLLHFYVGSTTSQTTTSNETCTPAITLTQTSSNRTTTQVITLCHTQLTASASTTPSTIQQYAMVTGDVSVGPAYPV